MPTPHPMFGPAATLRVLLCTALLLSASPGLATAQARAEPGFPTDVEMLSLPQESELSCAPPAARDTANVHLVFRIGSHPTDSREMHVDFAPDGALRSVGDMQWGREADRTAVMYTVVATWGERGSAGLFVRLRLREPAPSDSDGTLARQRDLTPTEVAKAKRLGEWLIAKRCDLAERTPP